MFNDLLEGLKKGTGKFFKNRVLVLGIVLIPCIIALFVRLFELQLVRGSDYYDNYVNTTKKEVTIPSIRGNIYDRNGVLLAGNKVVYNVTITDEEYYTKSNGAFNEMLLRLIRLLEKYDLETVNSLPVVINESGQFEYSGSDSTVRRLIKDVYGKDKIEDAAKEGVDMYSYDAETVMSYMMTLYNFNPAKWAGASEVSKEDALKICNIRYALAATSYTRYISTIVVSDVSKEVQAAVLESQNNMYGVNVEEAYERVYYESECFSCILGYVGSITTEEIENLNAAGGDYVAGDMIGKEGVESYYESYLQGKKGRKEIYVNSKGIILSETIIEEPSQGNDIYLSIDAETTIATYNIIEQQLAGIIVNHLYEGTDYDPEVAYEKSEYLIPIRDVYFQMINNNILSLSAMAEDNASDVEKSMNSRLNTRKQEILNWLSDYLSSRGTKTINEMDSYYQAYVKYFYTFMNSEKYLKAANVTSEDEMYQKWKSGDASLPELIIYALKSGWADMTALSGDERYNTVDACYDFIVEILLEKASQSFGDFDKLIWDELIHSDTITGCEVGMALMEQGLLEKDEESMALLKKGGNDTAFLFFENKITSMELSPSQIALDPCSAGLVLTDPTTGELIAVASYPGYDSNRINDSSYYSMLLKDQSSPLYSRATQARLAPGSTFKMVTATAAMEEGYVGYEETIYCAGIYDKLDHPRCWIYRLENGEHGAIDVITALGQSCNCYFYECGYRFSTNADGQYSPGLGINMINKYASLYGFGELTGIECSENVSVLTTELPVTSAIGQGTNAFTTISLARYVTAIASDGNVYELKLLNRIEDDEDQTILSYSPQIVRKLEFADETWEKLHEGMYMVVHEGGSRNGDFKLLRKDYAAKSGSAQENRLRAEHGWYVTYGPYDDIHYAMAVQIPNGYSSGNAALIAAGVYEFLEGDITLEEILENSASSGNVNDIGD